MEKIYIFIEKSLEGFKNFSFDVDTELKQAKNCHYGESNTSLFYEIGYIRKDIEIIYLEGNDKSINRIKQKLLETRKTLEGFNVELLLKTNQFDFYFMVNSAIIKKINRLKIKHIDELLNFIEEKVLLSSQQADTRTEDEIIELKPVLKPEAVPIVFEIIKDYFKPEQQTALKQVIETGNKANEKLLFKDNGNRLTDTFKKLIEHGFITGCLKQDLINWIISNFTFTHQSKVKPFIYDTVEKIISRKGTPCKSPLINIEKGQIKKLEQPRTKKYNK